MNEVSVTSNIQVSKTVDAGIHDNESVYEIVVLLPKR